VSRCYEAGKVLGDGNFAVVKQCRHRESDREYAMKIIDKCKMAKKEDMIENEIAIMKQCDHINIVRLYEEYETNNEIYLIMELVKVRSAYILRCVSEKNAPNLESCSFDKHGLVFIIFDTNHQLTIL